MVPGGKAPKPQQLHSYPFYFMTDFSLFVIPQWLIDTFCHKSLQENSVPFTSHSICIRKRGWSFCVERARFWQGELVHTCSVQVAEKISSQLAFKVTKGKAPLLLNSSITFNSSVLFSSSRSWANLKNRKLEKTKFQSLDFSENTGRKH